MCNVAKSFAVRYIDKQLNSRTFRSPHFVALTEKRPTNRVVGNRSRHRRPTLRTARADPLFVAVYKMYSPFCERSTRYERQTVVLPHALWVSRRKYMPTAAQSYLISGTYNDNEAGSRLSEAKRGTIVCAPGQPEACSTPPRQPKKRCFSGLQTLCSLRRD